jgi:hypothetical protein
MTDYDDYHCKTCNYTTEYKSNFNKHLSTNKHIKTQEKLMNFSTKSTKSSRIIQEHLCKYCDKPFKHMQSMYYHIKYTCKQNKDEDLKELVRLMNLQLGMQRSQLEKKDEQLERQSRQIEKLMDKLKVPNNNIINNITQNNNIQLLSYNDTDTSHLTDKDYIHSLKQVTFCVKDMIERIHFNPTKPENMNIYISNMKDKYLMVYEDGNWNLKNKMNELDSLYESKEIMIEEWVDEEQHKYPELRDKFVQYLNNKENDETMNMVKEEIKLMMYNNKKKVVEG